MKKILPYILILIIFTGFLGPVQSVFAQGLGSTTPTVVSGCYINLSLQLATTDPTKCISPAVFKSGLNTTPAVIPSAVGSNNTNARGCYNTGTNSLVHATENPNDCLSYSGTEWRSGSTTETSASGSVYEVNMQNGNILLKWIFFPLYQLSAWLLRISALFFNALIAISLSGKLLKTPVVSNAWQVVRDLSNIFFILILLYIAIQIILDIGHGTKQMIAKVLIMALFINFSMFFTKIIIDTSNVLALVFYNKLTIETKRTDGGTIPYTPGTNENEKDLSGAMVNSFNPTKLMSQDFFDQIKKDLGENGSSVPTSIMIGVTVVAVAIMLFAAYAFFVSGLSFLGRLIELFVLIIFSPFAFMSSSLPLLGHLEYIGWDAWLKRLLSVSFMAPVFMFFMYFLFLLISNNIFTGIIVK